MGDQNCIECFERKPCSCDEFEQSSLYHCPLHDTDCRDVADDLGNYCEFGSYGS